METRNVMTKRVGFVIKAGDRYESRKSTITELVLTPDVESAKCYDTECKAQERLLSLVSSVPNADICELTLTLTPATAPKMSGTMSRMECYVPSNPYLKRYRESQKG